jgi:AbrB family looped-hinge helix DNA binding protein
MNATTEIDKAGRLVVPKKLRESLHLTPGTRVVLRKQGNLLTVQPEQPEGKLIMKSGFWVWDPGVSTSLDVVQLIEHDRADQARHSLGLDDDAVERFLP